MRSRKYFPTRSTMPIVLSILRGDQTAPLQSNKSRSKTFRTADTRLPSSAARCPTGDCKGKHPVFRHPSSKSNICYSSQSRMHMHVCLLARNSPLLADVSRLVTYSSSSPRARHNATRRMPARLIPIARTPVNTRAAHETYARDVFMRSRSDARNANELDNLGRTLALSVN